MPGPYTKAKAEGLNTDLARFACAFLHVSDWSKDVDWDAAAADFNPELKTASFKTMTMKAVKRLGLQGKNGTSKAKGDGASNVTPSPAIARKRKFTPSFPGPGDEGNDAAASSRGKGRKKAKVSGKEANGGPVQEAAASNKSAESEKDEDDGGKEVDETEGEPTIKAEPAGELGLFEG